MRYCIVTSLGTILENPAVAEAVEVLVRAGDRDVSSVALIEDLQAIADLAQGSVAVLTTLATSQATRYRLDFAVRLAQSSGVAALVLRTEEGRRPSTTSGSLASRSDIWLLRADPKTPLAPMVIAIQRSIDGGAAEELDRLERLVAALGGGDKGVADRILERASAAFGRRVEVGRLHPASVGAPIELTANGQEAVVVSVPPDGGRSHRVAAEIAATLIASALARLAETTRRAADVSVLSAAEVLTELLANHKGDTASLLGRARTLDIPVDGWHVALRLDLEPGVEPTEVADELEAYETRQAVVGAALEYAKSRGGNWYLGRSGTGVVLLRMYKNDAGQQAVTEVAAVAHGLLAALESRFPDIGVRCGIGCIHAGPAGLTSTAMEARVAVVASRAAGGANRVNKFDGSGLRRSLVDWYSMDTARDAVSTVLRPLDSLAPSKRDSLILTLKTYLDLQGSLSKTAETLYLHRNAVAYRVKRIFELLDVDPESSDDRLLLQLACRARAMV